MRKFTSLGLALIVFSVVLISYQNSSQYLDGRSPDLFNRIERLSRFYHFLKIRKVTHGGNPTLSGLVSGWTNYPKDKLLDPRFIKHSRSFLSERYTSYLENIDMLLRKEGAPRLEVRFGALNAPGGYVSPEDFDSRAGQEGYDSTLALTAAINTGRVWLTPEKTYMISKRLIISNSLDVISDGSARILIKTGPGTDFSSNDHSNLTNQVLLIDRQTNVSLRDFRIQMASEDSDFQPVMYAGIHIRDCENIEIKGVEFLGFPRNYGIVTVNSGKNISLSYNLFHGSYTRELIRQVSAIVVDSDRPNGNVKNLRVIGNLIYGVMLDNSIFFDTSIRGQTDDGKSIYLGYETDGINLQSTHIAPNNFPSLIEKNSIMDVGEGLDIFSSDAIVRGNYFERSFAHNLKVVHSASRNLFINNHFVAAGMAQVIIQSRFMVLLKKIFLCSTDLTTLVLF